MYPSGHWQPAIFFKRVPSYEYYYYIVVELALPLGPLRTFGEKTFLHIVAVAGGRPQSW